MVITDIHIRRI